MGLVNTICIKEKQPCPWCSKPLGYAREKGFTVQSKDLSNRCNKWYLGDKITIEDGGMVFESLSDVIWTGFAICNYCDIAFEVDIIIKKGIISKIDNFKKYDY